MKKNRTKRLLSKLLTLSMVLTLMMTCLVVLPTEVHAATNVPYLDAAGVEKTASTATEITASTNELTTGWYVVNGAVTRTETITVNGNVHLILADGCNLTVTGDERKAGINVNDANSLTIYDQAGHTGVLNVTGDQNGAGIGSGFNEKGGFITINGGIINATGGDGDYDNKLGDAGAGIGDGGYSDEIKIIINGGEIIATGGGGDKGSWTGAGIGGDESDITITGGKITATGGKNKDGLDVMGGAGIGGSGKAYVNTIIISGGTVTATGGPNAAGVGGGEMGVGGVITISGGVVNATGGNYLDESGFSSGGAGIGSGAGAHDHDGEYETTITISGTSTVTATGAFGSAGIGTGTGGGESNHSATITIDGGTVTGIGGVGGAGIGGGLMLDGGTITIKNGTVTATGGEGISGEELTIFGGTGIGGGSGASMDDFTFPSGSGGTANISGGLVFAKGDDSAKDIGGALDSSGGSLAISGTAAVFLRNDSSVEPVDTTTHTHKNIGNHVANTTAFGIPVSWDGNFGAWLLPQLYAVTVNSGTGSGDFDEGAAVSITANEPATGKVFDQWTTSDGVTFGDANNATTTFTMPAKAVTVTATYKDISSETPDYKIIAGENGIWKKGNTKGIVIISNGDYGDFTGVNVDGIFIDSSNYTSAAGSTVVTLKPAYLETLAVGTHIVTLQFGNYSVQTNLTILAADERPDESKPDESKPDESKPDESKPDESKPDESKPDESKPDESKPDESKPDESKPNEENPKTGDSNHTLPLIGLLLLSGSALIGVTRNKKKKKSYNK